MSDDFVGIEIVDDNAAVAVVKVVVVVVIYAIVIFFCRSREHFRLILIRALSWGG